MSENSEEQRARQWLEDQGYTDICDLSKDRKDPPDFAVANRIGVEVRQLTWMTDTATRENQGAEELEKPLERAICKVLQDAGEPPGGYSVSVSCDLLETFLPKPKVTRQQVGKAVDDYVAILDKAWQSGGDPESWRAHLKCKLDMHFQPFSTSGPGEFVLLQVEAATHLRGWVIKDSIDNVNRCIVDKTAKIQDRIHLYPEWWLVLPAHNIVTPGSREKDEWQTVRDGLVDTKPWSRVVVLDWIHPKTHVDLI